MAENVKVCDVSEAVKERLKKFRFRKEKNIAALMLKVDQSKMEIVLEEEYEDCTIEELQNELPGHQPRFLIISYKFDHGDGRVSYPLCFVYCCPAGGKTELNLMYAGGRNAIRTELGITKEFEIRSTDELTEEWLDEKIKFFR